LDNGFINKDMGSENFTTKMAISTRGFGRMIREMGRADFMKPLATGMKEDGLKIKKYFRIGLLTE